MPPSIKNLSVSIFQIKNKSTADTKALRSLRPIGLPHDLHQPLPYLAVVMELGDESNYQQHQVTPSSEGVFRDLWAVWEVALRTLNVYEEKKAKENKVRKWQEKGQKDPERTKLLDNVKTTRAAMDAYNQYTINIRGASPTAYRSLKGANIVSQFATLIKVTMPSHYPRVHITTYATS
jgi:hypothetical protein